MVGAILFVLLAGGAGLLGAGAIMAAETIMHQLYGGLLLILAGVLLVSSVLCSIESGIARSFKKVLAAVKELREEEERREHARRGIAEERWEILARSLDKLESRPAEPLKARCSKCGRTVKAKNDWAGKQGQCPGCGGRIEFPAAPMMFDGVV